MSVVRQGEGRREANDFPADHAECKNVFGHQLRQFLGRTVGWAVPEITLIKLSECCQASNPLAAASTLLPPPRGCARALIVLFISGNGKRNETIFHILYSHFYA